MSPRLRTIEDLRRELRAKEAQLDTLMARRAKAAARLESIDRKVRALGGETPSAPRGVKRERKGRRGIGGVAARRRGPRGKALIEYLKEVLAKARNGMRAKDVKDAVVQAGYPTSAKDFYGIVATALRDTRTFQKIRRGIYKLKG
jgi:hypothetical protein